MERKCEKHAKKEEALEKLSEGVKFDEVARTYSEDKARQGILNRLFFFFFGILSTSIVGDTLLTIFCLFATGGSLGWKTKGSLDPTFEEVAFSLPPSTTSSPKIGEAKTPFGYHIIMVSLEWLFPVLGIFRTFFNVGFHRSKGGSEKWAAECLSSVVRTRASNIRGFFKFLFYFSRHARWP